MIDDTILDSAFDKLITIADNYYREWKGALTLETCTEFSRLFHAIIEFVEMDKEYELEGFDLETEEVFIAVQERWNKAYNKLRNEMSIL